MSEEEIAKRIQDDERFWDEYKDKYDYIIVQGDTFSALVGALWGYYNQVPVAHIEAGLRTFREDPFPEERNRVIIDELSTLRFCPTMGNAENIFQSRFRVHENFVVGNTIIDRLKMELFYLSENELAEVGRGAYICTLHRRESWDEFEEMLALIREVSDKIKKNFLFITNPNRKLNKFFRATDYMEIVEPMSYRKMVEELINCEAVVTDSGGLIEEASYLRKPCYILRDYTERLESVESELAQLLGRGEGILNLVSLSQNDHSWFNRGRACPYGQGNSAKQILTILSRRIYE